MRLRLSRLTADAARTQLSNLLPGALRIGMAGRRFTEPAALDPQHAGHDVEVNAAARKGAGNLRHAAGATIRQPFPGVRLRVIQRADRLQVEDQHRGACLLNRGQHLAARGVGADVTNDQFHSFAGKQSARGSRRWGRIHQPRVHHVAELVQVAAHDALVAFEPALQALELRPIRRQPNAEQSDFSSLCQSHSDLCAACPIPSRDCQTERLFLLPPGEYCPRAQNEEARYPSACPAACHNA